ncbi:MAG TPA: ABC transporter permease [Tepidiformaceae bacterium]|nr:ABC transporter permease [Tepidiformaceae bacterium]
MTAYLVKRGGAVVPTVLGIVTIVFLMVRLIPGDPATAIGGETLSGEALERLRERLGTNGPLLTQYWNYISSVAQFDLGRSLHTGLPVTKMVMDALPVTVVVGLSSLVLGMIIAVPIGAFAAYARSRGKVGADSALTTGSMIVDTIPGFWLALIFILFFSIQLGWFPVSGPIDWGDPVRVVKRLALPVSILAIGQVASVARITRTAVLESLNDDYVRTARALGTPELQVLFRHALRNSALPLVTITGLSVGRLIGGTVITESIFSLPGMGTVLIKAIAGRDYPVIQGVILLFALMFVVVNVLTDLVYTRVDPRVRLS